MKSAIYIDDGTTQVVLTPESKLEEAVLDMIFTRTTAATFRGGFYECQGGWIRRTDTGRERQSLIVRLNDEPLPEVLDSLKPEVAYR